MLKSIKIPKRLIIKVFVLLMVFYTIFHTTSTSLQNPLINQYKLKVQRQVKLKFRGWYTNLLSTNLKLEEDKNFEKQLNSLLQEKLKNDVNNELWDINPLMELPLDITVPSYFINLLIEKPSYQPFDARFTLSVYLNYLATKNIEKKGVPFHWSDWVDLTKLNKYILSRKNEKPTCKELFDILKNTKLVENSKLFLLEDYCKEDLKFPLGFKVKGFSGPQTIDNHEILSKAHLYLSFPSPYKLIFLTELKGSYEIPVINSQNDLKYSLLNNKMVEKVIKSRPRTNLHDSSSKIKLNPLKAYKDLLKYNPPTNGDKVLKSNKIDIPIESFNVDAEAIKNELSKKRITLKNEIEYLNSLKNSLSMDSPPKFFKETKLLEKNPQKWLGEHYDWRFFNGLTVGKEEQILSLHRLIKNYLNFARQNGLITWIAHGSLLSWYWNGIAFPWDTDIDVQMPIGELHELSRRFNQSLVIENVGDDSKFEFSGMGKYFIDIGSSITHRTKGNGNNNIDGRFIDVDTGLYIDITGLAITDTPAPSRYDYLIDIDEGKREKIREHTDENGQMDHYVKNEELPAFNCRNNHFNTYEEISPLLLTAVENQLSYVPSNFIMTLNYEYGLNGLIEKNFRDYIYLNNFRIWVKTQDILDYLNNPSKWIQDQEPKNKRVVGAIEKLQINKLNLNDHISLLKDNRIFKEYYKSRFFTKFHQDQLNLLQLNEESTKEFNDLLTTYQKLNGLSKPLRADLFMYNYFKNDRDYDAEINHIIKLNSVYRD